MSLFDVENVDGDMPRVRDMTIGRVSTSDVDEFAHRYHYANGGLCALWRWGLYDGLVLHGVVSYNTPSRQAQAAVFGEEHIAHIWNMGRLIFSDRSPRNCESRLIAGSLRAIQREHPHVWAVLTYAATDAGHIGYVYQATNAIYTGTGGNTYHWVTPDNQRRSTVKVEPAIALQRGWRPVVSGVKHRYLYILGNKTERRERMRMLKLPSLPYPKATQDVSAAAS